MLDAIETSGTLQSDLVAMSRRAKDWTPMSAAFRKIVRDYHKMRHARERMNVRTGEISRSVTEPAVWDITPNMLTYGTDLDYGHYYAKWRRENGLSELVLDTPTTKIRTAYADYIISGRNL